MANHDPRDPFVIKVNVVSKRSTNIRLPLLGDSPGNIDQMYCRSFTLPHGNMKKASRLVEILTNLTSLVRHDGESQQNF